MINRYINLEDERLFNIKLSLISGLLALAIFVVDLNIPLGVAGGVPYIIVILVSLGSRKSRVVIDLAMMCTFLTLLGFYFSPAGGELWQVISNRFLALSAIWVTTILALKWKRSEVEISLFEHKIEKEKEKIYLATIHGAQHITNNLLNQLQLVEFEIKKHSEFDKDVSSLFKDMLAEANSLMINLSSVDKIDDEIIAQSVYPQLDT
jgi:hypothetical protein